MIDPQATLSNSSSTPDRAPSVLSVLPDGIPAELRARLQWVNWRYDRETAGKWGKVPYSPGRSHRASSNKLATWGTFADAVASYGSGQWAGVGYVFSPDDPFCGIDLDDCRDAETGAVAGWARPILADLPSYAEISPSGTGIKLIVVAAKPEGKSKAPWGTGQVEMYDIARYFALTGRRLETHPAGVRECQGAVSAWHAAIMSAPRGAATRGAARRPSGPPTGPEELARNYVAKMPPAVSGRGGHNATFSVALVLVRGFGLTLEQARPIMADYNSRCLPPWSEQELDHKLTTARDDGRVPMGYILPADGWRPRAAAAPSGPAAAACGSLPPAAPATLSAIILAELGERYAPTFKRGTVIHSSTAGREVASPTPTACGRACSTHWFTPRCSWTTRPSGARSAR